MNHDELELLQDSAADSLLRVRERIEAAVDTGEIPVWVMDACAALERASLVYGAAAERMKLQGFSPAPPQPCDVIH